MHAVVDLVDGGGGRRGVDGGDHVCSVWVQHYARVVIVLHQNCERIFRQTIFVGVETVGEFAKAMG